MRIFFMCVYLPCWCARSGSDAHPTVAPGFVNITRFRVSSKRCSCRWYTCSPTEWRCESWWILICTRQHILVVSVSFRVGIQRKSHHSFAFRGTAVELISHGSLVQLYVSFVLRHRWWAGASNVPELSFSDCKHKFGRPCGRFVYLRRSAEFTNVWGMCTLTIF